MVGQMMDVDGMDGYWFNINNDQNAIGGQQGQWAVELGSGVLVFGQEGERAAGPDGGLHPQWYLKPEVHSRILPETSATS